MPTYRFADDEDPVQEHMAGLISGLESWILDCERQIVRARTGRDAEYWRGKRDGFREVIAVIEDSTSI